MARLAASTLAIGCATLVMGFFTVFNGYCGDGASVDDKCEFDVATQTFYLVLAVPVFGGLAAFGVSRLPQVRDSWRWIAAGAVTLALLIVPWVLLVHGMYDRLDYWHSGGQGGSPDDHIHDAAWVVLVTPFVAWAAAGAGRRSARLFAYATALAAGSGLIALAYTSWYYDRHF